MKILGAGVLLLLATVAPAPAEQWGSIVPGESTMQELRARYGGPTRQTTTKTDGYDTAQWVYDGAQTPAGVRRLTVDFGLMGPAGFHSEVVRRFILEPKPGAFTLETVMAGWGPPHGTGRDGESEFFFYKEGLFVYFDKDRQHVVSMVFTPPQLRALDQPAPQR